MQQADARHPDRVGQHELEVDLAQRVIFNILESLAKGVRRYNGCPVQELQAVVTHAAQRHRHTGREQSRVQAGGIVVVDRTADVQRINRAGSWSRGINDGRRSRKVIDPVVVAV